LPVRAPAPEAAPSVVVSAPAPAAAPVVVEAPTPPAPPPAAAKKEKKETKRETSRRGEFGLDAKEESEDTAAPFAFVGILLAVYVFLLNEEDD